MFHTGPLQLCMSLLWRVLTKREAKSTGGIYVCTVQANGKVWVETTDNDWENNASVSWKCCNFTYPEDVGLHFINLRKEECMRSWREIRLLDFFCVWHYNVVHANTQLGMHCQLATSWWVYFCCIGYLCWRKKTTNHSSHHVCRNEARLKLTSHSTSSPSL